MTARRRCGWVAAVLAGLACIAPTHAAELLFQAEAQHLTGECTDRPVRLEGNHNVVQLHGRCDSLVVKGLANTVELTVASHGLIHVEGSQNVIHYAPAASSPVVEVLGPDNVVAPGSAVAPISAAPPTGGHSQPPPAVAVPATPAAAAPVAPAATQAPRGPLDLSGDDQQRLEDCAGHDVVLTGSRSAYVIRGACHSLVVRGDLLTIQAIMQPGARIMVTGQGDVVSWALKGKGRAPTATVKGAGSRVQRAQAIGGQPVR